MRKRGIVLITTILLVTIVAMVVAATISTAPTSLVSASNYSDSQRATLALDAGITYAQARLNENIGWRGSADTGPNVVVRTADDSFVVVEDHGNVVGMLKFDSGEYGRFRIRFNHQDGADGLDALEDPSADYQLDTKLISHNNLPGSSPQTVYAVENGNLTERTETVSAFQALIVVEGWAGPALRESDPLRPNDPPLELRLVRRMAEVRMQARFGDVLDAAAMAGGDIVGHFTRSPESTPARDALRRQLELRTSAEDRRDVSPRVRTKGEILLEGPTPSSVNFDAVDGLASTASGTLAGNTRARGVTPELEQPSDDFYSLEWDSLHHASSDPNEEETIHLKAGTYVGWEDSNGNPKLSYYDRDLDDYLAHMREYPDDTGLVLTTNLRDVRTNFNEQRPGGITFKVTDHEKNPEASKSLKAQLLIKDDVFVQPIGDLSEFNFIPRRGLIDGPPPRDGVHHGDLQATGQYNADNIMFQFLPRARGGAIFTSTGKVRLNSRVHGEGGAITAEGDISITGIGELAATKVDQGSDGLSLYSKGDVTVNTYKPNWFHNGGRYADIRLRGVVYAWGDVNFDCAPPADSEQRPGFFETHGFCRVFGSVIAYGADPSTGRPGSEPTKGNINLRAHNARFVYDSSYLQALDKLASPSEMAILSYTMVK